MYTTSGKKLYFSVLFNYAILPDRLPAQAGLMTRKHQYKYLCPKLPDRLMVGHWFLVPGI